MNLSLTSQERVTLAFEGLRVTANRLRGLKSYMRDIARTGPDGDMDLTCERLRALTGRPVATRLLAEYDELSESAELAVGLYKQVRAEHRAISSRPVELAR